MRDYVIITDSCVDLPEKLAQELNLIVLPLKVTVEGKEYQNFLDEREIKIKDFYAILREHKKTSTAQAIPAEFIEIMTPFLKENKDILSISFSSSLSGTYNSAQIASKDLLKEFPGAVIECVDSLSASMGQGLLVTLAAKKRLDGKSIEEVAKYVEDIKTTVCHLFTVSDLGHLRRGGRLSASSLVLGNLLNIKPLLHVNLKGELKVYGKARGRFKSLSNLVSRMEDTYDKDNTELVYISHGDCFEDALYVKNQIKQKLGLKEEQFLINHIGPVIGAHSGVNTLALFYIGSERTY